MAVKQSRSDILARRINDLRACSYRVRNILADISDAPPLYRNRHSLQNFTGDYIDQLPAGYYQRCRLIAAGCSHKLRHTIRQRFSNISHDFHSPPIFSFLYFKKNGLTPLCRTQAVSWLKRGPSV
ncbi:hypothetical protein D3C73_1447310 [compost metagenome]